MAKYRVTVLETHETTYKIVAGTPREAEEEVLGQFEARTSFPASKVKLKTHRTVTVIEE